MVKEPGGVKQPSSFLKTLTGTLVSTLRTAGTPAYQSLRTCPSGELSVLPVEGLIEGNPTTIYASVNTEAGAGENWLILVGRSFVGTREPFASSLSGSSLRYP